MLYVLVTCLLSSEMLVLPDLHTLECTMSELLELKLSAVPEMDPNQTSEHNGLNGLSLGDSLCRVVFFHIEAIHFALQRFFYTPFKCYCAFVVPYLVCGLQLGGFLLEN